MGLDQKVSWASTGGLVLVVDPVQRAYWVPRGGLDRKGFLDQKVILVSTEYLVPMAG